MFILKSDMFILKMIMFILKNICYTETLILRMPHYLQLLLSGGYGDSPPDFFNGCLDAPSDDAVDGAMQRLEAVGALVYSLGDSLGASLGGNGKTTSVNAESQRAPNQHQQQYQQQHQLYFPERELARALLGLRLGVRGPGCLLRPGQRDRHARLS